MIFTVFDHSRLFVVTRNTACGFLACNVSAKDAAFDGPPVDSRDSSNIYPASLGSQGSLNLKIFYYGTLLHIPKEAKTGSG